MGRKSLRFRTLERILGWVREVSRVDSTIREQEELGELGERVDVAANTKIRHEMEDTILSKDIKLRKKVTTITKRAVKQVSSLKQVITKKDKDISEISNMGKDVATEYNQLDNKRMAQARETTKQVEHHKKLAASRLEKMIQSQQEAADLQMRIESINEKHDEELAAVKSKIASLTRELRPNKEKKLTPHIIKKKGKHMEKIIIPKTQIMVESPSIRFVRYCRTVAIWCTKIIAAYKVALADGIIQALFDGTSRRQTEFNNFVAKIKDIYRPGHFRKATFDGSIIAEDGSAESTVRAFKA
ncbi:hypothetical protein HJC23_007023 [Cyclotella cryptica]|uniref:Uncharacterized protein n=1 Tax=Cyclotella cryptica TaxID=29204 RepID=A0ABD3QM53_9STRA